jgi:transposase
MRWLGVDLHKHYAHVAELSTEGVKHYRFALPGEIAEFCSGLQPSDQVVVEASTNSFVFSEIVSQHVARVVVTDPAQTRGVVSGPAMNDHKAAEALAKLLKTDFVRPVWLPPVETRVLRTQVAYYRFLEKIRTKTINRVRSLFQQELREFPPSEIGPKLHPFLTEQFLDQPGYRLCLGSLLRQINHLNVELGHLERDFGVWCRDSTESKLLMTIPGLGVVSATTLMAHIGTIDRFPSADQLCAYIGIVPKVHESGKVKRTGQISRQGPSAVRWVLSLAVQHLVRFPTKLTAFYLQVAERRPKRVARIAACRKLLCIIWSMLKYGKSFQDEDEDLTARKSRLLSKWAKPLPECREVPIVYNRRPSQGGMHRARTPKTAAIVE